MIGRSVRRPGAPTIVFLHGAGLSSWMWGRQLAALPEFDVVALDLPGHGVSITTPFRSVAETTDLVAEWIRANATNGRAHVVGLSLGGVVGLNLAAREPSLIDRMAVSGALGMGLPGAEFLGWLMEAMMPLARIGWMVRLSARTLRLSPADQEYLAQDIRRMPPGLARLAVREVAAFRLTPALLTSPIPALVVAGTREHSRIRQTVARIGTEWPAATARLVPKATHVWNWQLPDLFDAMLRSWFIDRRAPDFLVAP